MKKKNIIILVGILLIMLGMILTFITNQPNEIELTYKMEDKEVYKWEYEIHNPEIVKYVKSTDDDNSIHYIFKGKKQGNTHITFKYINTKTNIVEKEESVLLKVDKHKKISLNATGSN